MALRSRRPLSASLGQTPLPVLDPNAGYAAPRRIGLGAGQLVIETHSKWETCFVYIPEYNRIEDNAVALAFAKANPFAIVVSSSHGVPFATHIPMLVRERSGQIVLIGHVAKANPHWKLLQQEQESLVIFHGPHAYISPRLYESRESVPTWNYAAVHIYGPATVLLEADRLKEILVETLRAFDPAYLDQWSALREEYRNSMLNHIAGFEITAQRIEGKFKLSQNRSKRDQAKVIESLQQSEDSASSAIAQLMKEQGLGS